ncbi:beta-ketoacyl-[acyl-carrier-protein] synthase II, partial [Pseudomonas frederiksbergensis]|nr:beta-ketoacyl-[acyl-carrier-protein] synthase II [Pseudomonas frederiksbergensis]
MTAYLNALGLVCALGRGQADVARRLFAGDCSGMRVEDGWVPQRGLPVAAVQDKLPSLPAALQAHHSRNNQLLYVACLQIGAAIEAAI